MYDNIYGIAGEQNNGVGIAPIGVDRQGAVLISPLHNSRYQQAKRGKYFYANATAGILSAAGTAMTGLILWNGSTTVDLVLDRVQLIVSVTSASLTGIGLGSTVAGAQTTTPATTTAITKTGSTYLGQANSLATPYTVATTLAVTTLATLMHNTAAIATTGADAIVVDLNGFIVPPYTAVALTALGAASAAAAVSATIFWEEVPV